MQRNPEKEKAAPARATLKNNLRNRTYQNRQNHQGKFNREALPAPAAVLRKLGMIPSDTANQAGYVVLCCPFHNNGQEQHASLNIHAISGHYKCHACGAHGGDVLAFYIAVTGKPFADAARDLGAWRAGA